MSGESGQAIIDGERTCHHRVSQRTYLGQMGTASFYQCSECDGVVVTWLRR